MIRIPVVAGRFYENDEVSLLKQLEKAFAQASEIKVSKSGRLQALISPHAGYMFSGKPAAVSFTRLKIEESLPERILILGPKHTQYGAQFAVSSSKAWETPLGKVDVDTEFCQKICREVPEFMLDDQAHQYEHSIEVQLPFLQYVYQNKKLKIVPVAIGYSSYADLQDKFSRLRDKLFAQGFANTLILVSSDFSHDTPKELAYKLDAEVIEKIVALHGAEFYDLVIKDNRSVCGVMPISAMLILLQNSQTEGKLLHYSTSMDVMEHERGVGYAAVSFEKKV